MAITINGTTVTTNRINGTSISKETVNGTQVYGATLSKVWVLIAIESSEPQTNLGIIESSTGYEYDMFVEVTAEWPPNNYTVGTTAAIYDGHSYWYLYQIQGE